MTRYKVIYFFRNNSIYLAWLVSVIALSGSLFFSDIMEFEPCKLCWFQRICMYPLIVILGIACFKNDYGISIYGKTLSSVGGIISLVHYLEQKIPGMQNVLPCKTGVPCSGQYINWLGFITIPFLAMISFILIIMLLSIDQNKLG
jgi:disulfide bond formation protein DsbB